MQAASSSMYQVADMAALLLVIGIIWGREVASDWKV